VSRPPRSQLDRCLQRVSARVRLLTEGQNAGFSLIEVLAALVITGGLLAALLPFASNVSTYWLTGQRSLETSDLWMRLSVRLSADIARAIPLPVGTVKEPRLFWASNGQSILFVRPSVSAVGGGRLEVVAYTIERADDGQAVIRRSMPYDPGALDRAPSSIGNATALASGPFQFQFVTIGREGQAVDAWQDPRELPARVELAIAAAGNRPVPEVPMGFAVAARRPGGEIDNTVEAREAAPRTPAAPLQSR
jgi:general secretion pathway protein J